MTGKGKTTVWKTEKKRSRKREKTVQMGSLPVQGAQASHKKRIQNYPKTNKKRFGQSGALDRSRFSPPRPEQKTGKKKKKLPGNGIKTVQKKNVREGNGKKTLRFRRK